MPAAVNLGDDADTTAAVYGQIAGAHYGESGIPAEVARQARSLGDASTRLRAALLGGDPTRADRLRADRPAPNA